MIQAKGVADLMRGDCRRTGGVGVVVVPDIFFIQVNLCIPPILGVLIHWVLVIYQILNCTVKKCLSKNILPKTIIIAKNQLSIPDV